MSWKKHDYDDIPGTYVFDGRRANLGYHLNKMAYSFNDARNREEFSSDMAKIAIFHGLSVQDAGAAMSDISTDDFQARLDANAAGMKAKLDREGGYYNG